MGKLLTNIRGLSPLGPIFGRELRATSRRKRTYLLRFVYLGALLLILLFFHMVSSDPSERTSVAARAQHNAEMGLGFFSVFCFFTLFSMALIGPILTSTAVNSERLHKTLAVLLMTPITAWQVVSGKLFSRLLIALTLIGLSLPVLAVVRLLGGVELDQMIGALGLCVATVFMTAAIGLLFSTLMNRAYAVILLSYAFLLILWALAPMALGMMVAISASMARAQLVFTFVSLTNPFFHMEMLCNSDARLPFQFFHWWTCSLFEVGLGAGMLILSALILRRMGRKVADGGGAPATMPPMPPMISIPPMLPPILPPPLPAAIAPTGAAGQNGGVTATVGVPAIPIAAQGGFSKPLKAAREVSDNPVLWREIRRPLMPRRWQALVSVILVLGILTLFYLLLSAMPHFGATSALAMPDAQIGFAVVFCGLFNILVCIISATAIAQEKESDTWTLLLATPMQARRIVWGKVAGLLRRLMWPAILIVAHFLVFTLASVISIITFFLIVWMIFSTNAIWLATGLYYSLRLKTVTFAIILNLLSLVIFYGVAAMVLGIGGEVLNHSDNGAEIVGLYAPYPYLVTQISRYEDHSYNPEFANLPVFGTVDWLTFWECAFACGIGHLAATAGMLTYTVRRFDHIVGRAPQSAEVVDMQLLTRPQITAQ